MNMKISLDDVQFAADGLVPVIVQDVLSGEVLMMAWANRESLEATLTTGMMTFWSRSRKEIWKKGETSGNTLLLQELRLDCDGDALLALVEPAGPACHTGERSCFHRLLTPPCEGRGTFPGILWRYLEKRRLDDPKESYTARLLSMGLRRVAQKVGEEGVETALAVAAGDRKETVYEAADLLYHLEAALLASGVSPREVYAELERRHKCPPSPQGQTTERPS
jgi:phosphoribosyl-ATP pyrophosphohydrolase/phosphoribosyl-AMP cyclohydrolase